MKKNSLFNLAIALFAGLVQLTAQAEPFAYITDLGYNTVIVVDTATNSITTRVPISNTPYDGSYGVAVSPDGSRIYASNYVGGTLSVIDAATNTLIGLVAPSGLSRPNGLSFSPDGSRIYVANEFSRTVSVIDAASNNTIATIPVGANPYAIALTPNGTRAYVTNSRDGTVSVIDTSTNSVVATVPVGSNPYGFKISPDGSRVYVSDYASNFVSVIDTATNNVTATISLGTPSAGISISPNGSRAYVTNLAAKTVTVIDTATNSVVASVAVGASPIPISVTPDGSRVYVGNYDDGTLSIIETATNSVIATLALGGFPFEMTIAPPRPTAAPTLTPAANLNGWNKTDVIVNWNWTDVGGPGIDAAQCTKTSVTSGEGTLALSATCKDITGVIGKATYGVNVDKIAPTCSVTAYVNATQPKDEKQVVIAANVNLSVGGSATSYKILTATSTNKEGEKSNEVLSWTQTATGLTLKLGHERKADTIYSLSYQAYDLAGNTGNCSTTAVKIKK